MVSFRSVPLVSPLPWQHRAGLSLGWHHRGLSHGMGDTVSALGKARKVPGDGGGLGSVCVHEQLPRDPAAASKR